jgi:hypothetical protein
MSPESGHHGVMEESTYRARFANGETSLCATIEEARQRITRRAEHDPPPPGILPAEIAELDIAAPSGFRLIERFPPQ